MTKKEGASSANGYSFFEELQVNKTLNPHGHNEIRPSHTDKHIVGIGVIFKNTFIDLKQTEVHAYYKANSNYQQFLGREVLPQDGCKAQFQECSEIYIKTIPTTLERFNIKVTDAKSDYHLKKIRLYYGKPILQNLTRLQQNLDNPGNLKLTDSNLAVNFTGNHFSLEHKLQIDSNTVNDPVLSELHKAISQRIAFIPHKIANYWNKTDWWSFINIKKKYALSENYRKVGQKTFTQGKKNGNVFEVIDKKDNIAVVKVYNIKPHLTWVTQKGIYNTAIITVDVSKKLVRILNLDLKTQNGDAELTANFSLVDEETPTDTPHIVTSQDIAEHLKAHPGITAN